MRTVVPEVHEYIDENGEQRQRTIQRVIEGQKIIESEQIVQWGHIPGDQNYRLDTVDSARTISERVEPVEEVKQKRTVRNCCLTAEKLLDLAIKLNAIIKPNSSNSLSCTSHDFKKYFVENNIDPKNDDRFKDFYLDTVPSVVLTYEWDSDFSQIYSFFNLNSLQATKNRQRLSSRSSRKYKISSGFPTNLSELKIWMDVFFINQNDDIGKQLCDTEHLYQKSEYHFILGSRRVLSRCWCLYELMLRLSSGEGFIFLSRDDHSIKYDQGLDLAKGIQDASVFASDIPDFFGKMQASNLADKERISMRISKQFGGGEEFNKIIFEFLKELEIVKTEKAACCAAS